jgi:hypothetical protein
MNRALPGSWRMNEAKYPASVIAFSSFSPCVCWQAREPDPREFFSAGKSTLQPEGKILSRDPTGSASASAHVRFRRAAQIADGRPWLAFGRF